MLQLPLKKASIYYLSGMFFVRFGGGFGGGYVWKISGEVFETCLGHV